jgi:hypothetical protein
MMNPTAERGKLEPAAVPDRGAMVKEGAEGFVEEAERVNALVEGLRKGTVSAEDVDARERSPSADAQAGSQASAPHA